jgi:hypothetical protein
MSETPIDIMRILREELRARGIKPELEEPTLEALILDAVSFEDNRRVLVDAGLSSKSIDAFLEAV